MTKFGIYLVWILYGLSLVVDSRFIISPQIKTIMDYVQFALCSVMLILLVSYVKKK